MAEFEAYVEHPEVAVEGETVTITVTILNNSDVDVEANVEFNGLTSTVEVEANSSNKVEFKVKVPSGGLFGKVMVNIISNGETLFTGETNVFIPTAKKISLLHIVAISIPIAVILYLLTRGEKIAKTY